MDFCNSRMVFGVVGGITEVVGWIFPVIGWIFFSSRIDFCSYRMGF